MNDFYAFQPAMVLPNISSFLCLKLCYVSYYLLYIAKMQWQHK